MLVGKLQLNEVHMNGGIEQMYLVIIKRGFFLPVLPLEHVLQFRAQLCRYFSGKRNIRQCIILAIQKTLKKTECVLQKSDGR